MSRILAACAYERFDESMVSISVGSAAKMIPRASGKPNVVVADCGDRDRRTNSGKFAVLGVRKRAGVFGIRLLGINPTAIFSVMSEVTRILSAIEQGDPSAAEQLLPLVYDELRRLAAQKLAKEKPGQTLDA